MHAITAKAGMVGLTRALAKELAPHVTVNTSFQVQSRPCEASRRVETAAGHLPDSPLGRRGKPEEIASMVRFWLS